MFQCRANTQNLTPSCLIRTRRLSQGGCRSRLIRQPPCFACALQPPTFCLHWCTRSGEKVKHFHICVEVLSQFRTHCTNPWQCSVATSRLTLRWMCDSPRTECERRTTPICTWHEQAIMEWLRCVISADSSLWTIEKLTSVREEWLRRSGFPIATIASGMSVRRNFSRVGAGNVEILLIVFRLLNDAMQIYFHRTLYPFYPISLYWSSLNYQPFVWNVFQTSAIRKCFFFS